MPLGTRVALVQVTGRPATREANTNQPTVSHFFTRNATVRHRAVEGQGKRAHFFNRFKDLAATSNAKIANEKTFKKNQIGQGLKVKCYEKPRAGHVEGAAQG